jgi:hypothetical protein
VWRDKALFDENPEEVPLTVSLLTSADGAKPLLKTRLSNNLEYYDFEKSTTIVDQRLVNYIDNDAFLITPSLPSSAR